MALQDIGSVNTRSQNGIEFQLLEVGLDPNGSMAVKKLMMKSGSNLENFLSQPLKKGLSIGKMTRKGG